MIIARTEGPPTSTTISLRLLDDGSLRLEGHDVGRAPRQHFGADDYEYGVTVPADGLPKLVLALLKDRYAADLSAVSRFHTFCKDNEVPAQFWSYP